jgi:zinc protease
MKRLAALALFAALSPWGAPAQMRVVALPGKSPLVTFRIVFTTGSVADPPGKPGLAYLTARMLADGGSQAMTYQQIEDALYPMAASFDAQVDKEMSTFSGATHIDNLAAYYKLIRGMLLDPGWRPGDFERVKDDAINAIRVGLRGNDEVLAKEVLYQNVFEGTPYGPYSGGSTASLREITLEDVQRFYRSEYSPQHLIMGIAGGYPANFVEKLKKDFGRLPAGAGLHPRPNPPALIPNTRVVIVEKDTRSVAYSIGFPISVTRAGADYPALLLASSWFGQHRMSGGVLYDEMREKRGLNYGDYSYIEYFPRGMFLMEPPPNVARRFNLFEMWIRPVEPRDAAFTLRLALFELDKLIRQGIPQDAFERTRDFLAKYVNVLTRSQRAELGYAIDSAFFVLPPYADYLHTALGKLTRDEVNLSLRRNLRASRLVIVAVAPNGEELKRQLAGGEASPISYNSPKPAAITEEDKIVEAWPLHLRPEDITVIKSSVWN